MTSSLDLIRGRQVVQTLTNQSGGAIIAGDVVIVSTANDESFTTTTSAAYNSTRVGVAQESIAAAATGRILLEGYAPLVNVSASATRGHYLLTHTVAKQATSQAGYAAGAFGQILKAGTTPSAMIFPVAQVGSAGVARSGSTTDGHLAVWNGSNADSIKDGGVPATSGMVKIATLGSGASFDFTSIAGTYTDLKIIGIGRGDTAAAGIGVHILFNNDSAGNYDSEFLNGNATTVSSLEFLATAQNYAAGIPAASAAAGLAGTFEITIPNYAGTTFNKRWHSVVGQSQAEAVGGHTARVTAGQWRNTAAITRVTLICTTGNFAAGSTATLYGLG